jgi:hypothetical protein
MLHIFLIVTSLLVPFTVGWPLQFCSEDRNKIEYSIVLHAVLSAAFLNLIFLLHYEAQQQGIQVPLWFPHIEVNKIILSQ